MSSDRVDLRGRIRRALTKALKEAVEDHGALDGVTRIGPAFVEVTNTRIRVWGANQAVEARIVVEDYLEPPR